MSSSTGQLMTWQTKWGDHISQSQLYQYSYHNNWQTLLCGKKAEEIISTARDRNLEKGKEKWNKKSIRIKEEKLEKTYTEIDTDPTRETDSKNSGQHRQEQSGQYVVTSKITHISIHDHLKTC